MFAVRPMIDVSLERLLQLASSGDLPPLCNVTVRLAGAPQHVNDASGRWEIPIEAPKGGAPVWVAIHRNPHGLDLGYSETSTDLLQILDKPELRSILDQGELVALQGTPRWSNKRGALYLNVEAILIIRPWITFGRRQVDYSAKCSRKHFLAVAKGVRARAATKSLTWQSLAGSVAHDLMEASVNDLSAAQRRDDTFLRHALAPATVARLFALGVVDASAMISAVSRGINSLEILQRSAAVLSLLQQGGPWQIESDAFDRGVTLTPDLIGDRVVVELKLQSPDSAALRSDINRAQAESYLAWAMVVYGIDPVVSNWRAKIINLDRRVDEVDRITEVQADRKSIGRRVFHRHRLLALVDGGWLPPPREGECTYCEFHRQEDDDPIGLPAACQYYCQSERSWSCEATDGTRECPLYGVCDQYNRYEAYERIDLFNRLRRDLIIEEEEAELAALLVAADQSRTWGPFRLIDQSKGILRLRPHDEIAALDAAIPGQMFSIVAADRTFGSARFRRLRHSEWILVPEGPCSRLPDDVEVRLSPRGISPFPARDQLAQLDVLQRLGEPPGVLRTVGAQRASVERSNVASITDVAPTAQCVIVDCGSPTEQATVVDILSRQNNEIRLLVLAGPTADRAAMPQATIWLDDFSALHGANTSTPTIVDALKSMAGKAADAAIVAAPWYLLFEGVLDFFANTNPSARRFTHIAVLDANAFPALGLHRCFAFAREKVVLLGSSFAAGPWTEAISSAASPLFQNLVRSIIESDGSVLPEPITSLSVVQTPIKLADGLHRLPSLVARNVQTIPTTVHNVDGATALQLRFTELRTTVALADPSKPRLTIELRVLPNRPIAVRQARTLLRMVAPTTIDEFRDADQKEGEIDHRLLTLPVRIDRIGRHLTGDSHRILLKIPETTAPLVVREGLANEIEAAEIASFAAGRPNERFVATSPFTGQCRMLARAAASKGLDNLRVVSPERLGQKVFNREISLIVSLAATEAQQVAGWPFSDVSRLVPIFVGDWNTVHVFCSREMRSHPFIQLMELQSAAQN
jgi:hypothetical protein